jgi:hypothetical protein
LNHGAHREREVYSNINGYTLKMPLLRDILAFEGKGLKSKSEVLLLQECELLKWAKI